MKKTLTLGCATLATALSAMTGCSQFSAGDYVIYRVALSNDISKSDGCYPDEEVDPNEEDDSTSFKTSATFIMYAVGGDPELYYLDATVLGNAVTLEGESDGDSFSFEGIAKDVQYSKANGKGDEVTTKTTVSVEMTVEGESVEGTTKYKVAVTCDGDNDTCPEETTCTQTQDFIGAEVDDVALEHDPA